MEGQTAESLFYFFHELVIVRSTASFLTVSAAVCEQIKKKKKRKKGKEKENYHFV